MKLRMGLAAAVLALGATGIAIAAPADIIKLREIYMEGNGAAAKVAVQMIKGEMPFDAAVAAAAAASIQHTLELYPAFFPAGTESGETKAAPTIWSDAAGFKAASDAGAAAAKAAAEAAAQGQEAFTKAFMALGGTCQSCHEKFRKS